jgi:hypothetical protein
MAHAAIFCLLGVSLHRDAIGVHRKCLASAVG